MPYARLYLILLKTAVSCFPRYRSYLITSGNAVTVGSKQQALLFLNQRSNNNPVSYIFAAKAREEDTNTVVFQIFNVKEGEYLVRVQVDGAESPLEVSTDNGYVGPFVEIG
jgi:hypothetical protein